MDSLNSRYFKSLYDKLQIIIDLYRVKNCKTYSEFFISKIIEINVDRNYFVFIVRHRDQIDNLDHHKFKMDLDVLDMSVDEINKYIDERSTEIHDMYIMGIMNKPLSIVKFDEEKPSMKWHYLSYWRYL